MMIVAYCAALAVANLLVSHFGPSSAPYIAFVLIGLDLTLRDLIHERRGPGASVALVLAAAAVSAAVSPAAGLIGLASAVAFVSAGLVDTAVYTALRGARMQLRVNASNAAAAAVDSLLFPTIAFGSLMPDVVAGQFAAKVVGGAIWALALGRLLRKVRQAA